MKYKTCHIARHAKSIGRFTPTYGEIEASGETEALDKTRLQLEGAGLETADCQCDCHCGNCKQSCDEYGC